MQRPNPVLLPVPRRVEWGSETLQLPSELVLVVAGQQQSLLPAVTRFQRFVIDSLGIAVSVAASPAGLAGTPHVTLVPDSSAVTHSQEYRLTVNGAGIRVEAGTPEGVAYGLATLKQLLAGSGRQVPFVTVTDWPDLGRRGLMLDISRGKVPTMADLYRLVDLLADLKLNEFQLYTEHTFAYRDHREVWQDYSPMTGEEILALDRYCRDRFIDLVPNQNSFGHLKEWLVHDRYEPMAEVKDGWKAWGTWIEGPFSLSPAVPETIPFLASLYDELLPHFTSSFFNVGCDETFDLGQGRAKEMVEQQGEHRVYVDQLLKIYDQVKAHGKTMQFWGDIIIKAPEYIAELPKDLIALEWGYEANHPFDEHCAHFAKAGVSFYVCPGTSTWNSLAGRTENAIGNMRSAAESGVKHGAAGFLNTIWGDRGHQDYEPVTYLPIAYGGAVSWAVEANRDVDVRPFLNQLFFRDKAEVIGDLLYDLGNVYKAVGVTPGNGSVLGYLMQFGLKDNRRLGDLTAANFDQAAGVIREILSRVELVQLQIPEGPLVVRELRNGIAMLLHACELGKLKLAMKAGTEPDRATVHALALDLDRIIAEHRVLWLERDRIGGLEEMSLAPLRKLRSDYAELLQG